MLRNALHFTGILLVLAGGSAVAMDSPDTSGALDLENVKSANQVTAARWLKQPNAYVLQVVLNGTPDSLRNMTRPVSPVMLETSQKLQRLGMVNIREALQELVPQDDADVRSSIETCEALQDLPTFRTCDQVRAGLGEEPALACARVQVWLLMADGTQILPPHQRCMAHPTSEVDFSYAFSLADGAQAVAAAVRVGDQFYIDKLQVQ